MNLKEINVAVNLRDNNIHVVRGIIKNDTGNILNLKLIDGTEAFDFTGYTGVVMNLMKPDGTFIVDGEGEHLQVIEPAEGRLSLKLDYEQAVLLTGMHFITISMYASTETDTTTGDNGIVKVTTARINYYVDENIDQTDDDVVRSENNFPILDLLITQCNNIYDNEYGTNGVGGRVSAEAARVAAEIERQTNEAARITAEAARADETEGIISRAAAYEASAANLLDLMQRIVAGEIDDYTDIDPIALKLDVGALKTELMPLINGMDGGATGRLIQIRRGTAANMPAALSAGELYVCTDTGKVYVGLDGSTNECINPDITPPIVISADAPTDTTQLWIDTGNGNAIKFYDDINDEWVGTATATYA